MHEQNIVVSNIDLKNLCLDVKQTDRHLLNYKNYIFSSAV